MSRPIGAFFHVPHGLSNAMLLPEITAFSAPAALERYADCARAMGVAEEGEGSQAAVARLLDELRAAQRRSEGADARRAMASTRGRYRRAAAGDGEPGAGLGLARQQPAHTHGRRDHRALSRASTAERQRHTSHKLRYKMRRIGIIVAAVLLLLVLAGYTAAWFIIAGRVEAGAAEGAEMLRAQNLDLTWQGLRVAGFPFSFRVELSQARLRATNVNPPVELRAPTVSAGTRPWAFRVWQLAAPEGLTVAPAAGATPAASLDAQAMTGSLYAPSDGSAQLWFGLTQPVAAFGLKASARYADLWLNLPPHAPQSHTEPTLTVGMLAYALELPLVPPPLKNPVDQLGFSGTLMGSFPPEPAQQAAQAWRDRGRYAGAG